MIPGQTASLTLQGWSSEEVDDWKLIFDSQWGDFPLEATFDQTMLGNGKAARLNLVVPVNAAAGKVAIGRFYSWRSEAEYGV